MTPSSPTSRPASAPSPASRSRGSTPCWSWSRPRPSPSRSAPGPSSWPSEKRLSRVDRGRQPRPRRRRPGDHQGRLPRLEIVAVPDDPAIVEADRKGVAPIDLAPDAPAVRALVGLAEGLLPTAAVSGAGVTRAPPVSVADDGASPAASPAAPPERSAERPAEQPTGWKQWLPYAGLVAGVWATLPRFSGPKLAGTGEQQRGRRPPGAGRPRPGGVGGPARRWPTVGRGSRGTAMFVAGLVVILAGLWMTATHVPLLAQAGRHEVTWGAAWYHSTPGLFVLAVGLVWAAAGLGGRRSPREGVVGRTASGPLRAECTGSAGLQAGRRDARARDRTAASRIPVQPVAARSASTRAGRPGSPKPSSTSWARPRSWPAVYPLTTTTVARPAAADAQALRRVLHHHGLAVRRPTAQGHRRTPRGRACGPRRRRR